MPGPGFIIDLAALVDTDELWDVAARNTASHFGVAWTTDHSQMLVRYADSAMSTLLGADARLSKHESAERLRPVLSRCANDVLDAGDLRLRDQASVLVRSLRERELPVAVISTLPTELSERCLDAVGLHDAIDVLCSPDWGPLRAPSFELHARAAGELRLDPHGSVAIEQTALGVESARDAGLLTLAAPTMDGPDDGSLTPLERSDLSQPAVADVRLTQLWPIDVTELLHQAARRESP